MDSIVKVKPEKDNLKFKLNFRGAHIEGVNWMPLTEVSSSPLDLVLLSVTSNNSLAFKVRSSYSVD